MDTENNKVNAASAANVADAASIESTASTANAADAASKESTASAANASNAASKESTASAANAEVCPCCQKTTERSEEERKKLITRLSIIEGQIRGIKGMIEKDAYCTDILVQSAAVNAAINSFNKELLARHIHTCVIEGIRRGDDDVVDELMDTLQKLMR